MYLRRRGDKTSVGGFEQVYKPMLRAASHLDMYALARRQLQIFIEHDPCCFAGNGFESYVGVVRRVSRSFSAALDTSTREHTVSRWAMRRIHHDLVRAAPGAGGE